MSDQGDAGQWRPATRHSGQHSAPDDTTGPLPAVPAEETDGPGVAPVSDRSTADDDAPTGGFPAVPRSDVPQPPVSAERAPFEPADTSRSESNGSWSVFEPASDEAASGKAASGEAASGKAASGGAASGKAASEPAYGSTHGRSADDGSLSFDDKPSWSGSGESSGAATPSFAPGAPDDGPHSFGGYDAGAGGATDAAETPPFELPKPQGVTAEEQAAENDFFASDDHPPMWDKVVAPAGPPPKPGKPSSGNLRLPDWMRDEQNAGGPPPSTPSYDEEDGPSRRPLYLGVGILVAGLVAATGVYLFKDKSDAESASHTSTPTQAPTTTPPAKNDEPQKELARFKGAHSKAVGRINDERSGLSYPKLGKPWALPSKKSPMLEIGFTASQFAVTEKAGGQPKHWARLMSAQLAGAAKDAYTGPGGERDAVAEVARVYEERMFGFRHTKKLLASQPLDVDGHKGWLVGYNVKYHRPGVKATGEIMTVALVDTGRKAPGVLLMSVPNTHRQLLPDVTFVLRSLKVG